MISTCLSLLTEPTSPRAAEENGRSALAMVHASHSGEVPSVRQAIRYQHTCSIPFIIDASRSGGSSALPSRSAAVPPVKNGSSFSIFSDENGLLQIVCFHSQPHLYISRS